MDDTRVLAHGQLTNRLHARGVRFSHPSPDTLYTLARHLSRSGNRTLDDIWSVTDQRGRARVTFAVLRDPK